MFSKKAGSPTTSLCWYFCKRSNNEGAITRISHKSTGSVVGKVGKLGKLGKFLLTHTELQLLVEFNEPLQSQRTLR